MHTATRPPAQATNGHGPPSPVGVRRRRLPLALVAGLIAVGCALLFSVLYQSASQRDPVIVIRKAVPAGRVLSVDDLMIRDVAASRGVGLVPAADRSRIIGMAALVDLAPGQLLAPGQVGEARQLAADEAVLSLAVPDAATPTLAVGDRVQVVDTANGTGDGVLGEGRVIEVSGPDGAGKLAVSLAVDPDLAPRMASAGAKDTVRLIRVPER